MVNNIIEKLRKSTTVLATKGRQKLLEFKGVHKTYYLGEQTIPALVNINFSICLGEFLTIVGPSGSGKSTFLNLVGLIDTPTKGIVEYEGKNVAEMSDNQITTFRNQKEVLVGQRIC